MLAATSHDLNDLHSAQLVDHEHDIGHEYRQALTNYSNSLTLNCSIERAANFRAKAKKHAIAVARSRDHAHNGLNLLGRIALDEGFYNQALAHLKLAIKHAPSDASCWYSFGHALLAKQDFEPAIDAFSRALHLEPKLPRADVSIAYALTQQGRVTEAFQAYRTLFKKHPTDRHIIEKLFETAALIKADYYDPALEQDLLAWLNTPDASFQNLSTLATSLLAHKYQAYRESAIIDLQDLARDELLISALKTLTFAHPKFEQFLCLVRKQLLLCAIASHYKDAALNRLAGAFSVQTDMNEHVFYQDDDEIRLVKALKKLIHSYMKRPNNNASELPSIMALFTMYEPLSSLNGIENITKQPSLIDAIDLKSLIQRAVFDAHEEQVMAIGIQHLANIDDPMSLKVKKQYEQNPYPRWNSLGYNTPTHYGRALEAQLAGFKAPETFNMGTLKVLVAGCGTGQHALKVARYFRNVEVTAVDLSQRALAYAKRMARHYQIDNIRFYCGDLLAIDQLEDTFDVIECSGVLHHMAQPEQGLQALLTRLKPDGVMKIGLYSHEARSVIRRIRSFIEQHDMPKDAEHIRQIRHALINKKLGDDINGITASVDFYSMSGCRDLLFHEQEHQFTTDQLSQLMDSHQLEFLGFILNTDIKNRYFQEHPEDPNRTNLNLWGEFERKYPDTFSRMYQFYVQKQK